MGSLMMKKVLFLILIVAGSISCSLGVEFERLAWGKGRKEKIACQLIRKANPRRSSYFACEDVKRNHMNVMGKFSTKYENLIPTGSQKIVDANLRYNQMPRLHKRHIYLGVTPSTGWSPGSPSHRGGIG
ncbi:hypothetical protein P3X46_013442 [Hevea brasiliensis]|uniref:SCP domain-containing protein n=1 Tax=Hevea brasiliensis TaxID=3981 RepID=A0ABQ9M3H7_HEVBR|nr:uncharacterized protein LOC110650677 [Hevea brasiliensis]KAJ9174841.1 hypothetical protein P3X46_013442 [Hevea brasiliensis]